MLKRKVRLCTHIGMQKWGDSYWEAYSPVLNILTVRLIIVISKIRILDSRAIDFVLGFPQAELEEYIWMQLPIGFQVDGKIEAYSDKQYVLKLDKNIYVLKQGSFNWYYKLKKLLVDIYFKPSSIDPFLYIDIDALVWSIKNGSEKLLLTDEGDTKNIFGIEITHIYENIFKVSQPFLIERIISLLNIYTNNYDMDTNAKSTPVGKPLLLRG